MSLAAKFQKEIPQVSTIVKEKHKISPVEVFYFKELIKKCFCRNRTMLSMHHKKLFGMLHMSLATKFQKQIPQVSTTVKMKF